MEYLLILAAGEGPLGVAVTMHNWVTMRANRWAVPRGHSPAATVSFLLAGVDAFYDKTFEFLFEKPKTLL